MLTAEKNKQKLASDAGLPPTAVSNYISKNNVPRADTALKLANALAVPLDWLVDDRRGWPPPPASHAASLSREQLAEELSLRSAGIVDAIWEKLRAARGVDWAHVALQASAAGSHDGLPDAIREQLEIPSQLHALRRELEDFVPPIPPMGSNALIRGASAFDGPGGFRRNPTILDLFAAIDTLERRPAFIEVFKAANELATRQMTMNAKKQNP